MLCGPFFAGCLVSKKESKKKNCRQTARQGESVCYTQKFRQNAMVQCSKVYFNKSPALESFYDSKGQLISKQNCRDAQDNEFRSFFGRSFEIN